MSEREPQVVADLQDILRSRTAVLRGILSHKYLKNTFLLPSERAASGRIQERPGIIDELTEMLDEYLRGFADGYDPCAFVTELEALQSLDNERRQLLLAILRREYEQRFRPLERLEGLRSAWDTFSAALERWRERVSTVGVSEESAALWKTLQERALGLHELLTDPALSTRWIP